MGGDKGGVFPPPYTPSSRFYLEPPSIVLCCSSPLSCPNSPWYGFPSIHLGNSRRVSVRGRKGKLFLCLLSIFYF